MSRFSLTVISPNSSRPSGDCTIPSRAIVAAVCPRERLALAADVARIGNEARDGVEQRRLAGAVQSDDRDEFALMHMERDVLQRLRLAIDDAQVLDLEERRLRVAKADSGRAAVSSAPPR